MDKNKYYLPTINGLHTLKTLIGIKHGSEDWEQYIDTLNRANESPGEAYTELGTLTNKLKEGYPRREFNVYYLGYDSDIHTHANQWIDVASKKCFFCRIPYAQNPAWHLKTWLRANHPELYEKCQKNLEARKEKEADDRKPEFMKRLETWVQNTSTPCGAVVEGLHNGYNNVLTMPELTQFLEAWRMECDMRVNDFASELRHILNKYGVDSRTSTPDYILADMIRHMLDFTFYGKVKAGAFVPLSKQWQGMEKHETPPRTAGMAQELAAGYRAPAEPVQGDIYKGVADKMFNTKGQETYKGEKVVVRVSLDPATGETVAVIDNGDTRTGRWKGPHVQPQTFSKPKKRYFLVNFLAIFGKTHALPNRVRMRAKWSMLPVVTNGEGVNAQRAERGAIRKIERFLKRADPGMLIEISGFQEVTEKDFQDFIKKDEI